MPDFEYRYRDYSNSEHVRLVEERLVVVKRTPKGRWVSDEYYSCFPDLSFEERQKHQIPMRWVGNDHQKQYCHPTKEAALDSFLKRKARQVKILKAQLKRAEAATKLTLEDTDQRMAFGSVFPLL